MLEVQQKQHRRIAPDVLYTVTLPSKPSGALTQKRITPGALWRVVEALVNNERVSKNADQGISFWRIVRFFSKEGHTDCP